MAIFTKSTPIQKLEDELASLQKRARLLATKRADAQAAFDDATVAREKFMLGGDLDDVKAGAKLQAAVDSIASALAGFDDAIKKQAALIADVEGKLAIERQVAERKAASDISAHSS